MPHKSALELQVKRIIGNLKLEAAAGPDQIPAAFIRGARVQFTLAGKTHHRHCLVDLITDICHFCLTKGQIPSLWKQSRLSPLYKKGDGSDPANYRLLAVSSCLYRIYGNKIREILMKWFVDNKKIPDTQFGFIPGRNTLQPLFILRHLIDAAKHRKADRQIYAAFIDSNQIAVEHNVSDDPHALLWLF